MDKIAINDAALTLDRVLNPDSDVDKYPNLQEKFTYEKLLIMYEGEKDKEQNQVQLFLNGQTVLLSPRQIYLHLKNKTSFAYHLVALGEEMEDFVQANFGL